MEKVRKDEVPFERSLSVGGYIYIYRAPRCTYAFSLEAATPSVDFLALTFDSKKREKNFSRLSRKFFSTYVSTLSRFGDERKRDMYRHLSGSTLIFF